MPTRKSSPLNHHQKKYEKFVYPSLSVRPSVWLSICIDFCITSAGYRGVDDAECASRGKAEALL